MVIHIEDQNYGKLTISWDNSILPSYCALKAIVSSFLSVGRNKKISCGLAPADPFFFEFSINLYYSL